MFGIKIWERYFAVQFLKALFLLIFGFYGLYILIDYSTHASIFHHYGSGNVWRDLALYYLCEFINRFNVIIPFAILIASIKTLCTLNSQNELVALLAGGVKLKKLLRPFIILGFFFTLLTYLNTQFLQPPATTYLKVFSEDRHSIKKKKSGNFSVEHLALADNSTLLFHSYDSIKERFYDCYWIRSLDDLYHIKFLYPHAAVPYGEAADHFIRDKFGNLSLADFQTTALFPEMQFNKKRLKESTTQTDELSLTSLWAKMPQERDCNSEKESIILTTFYLKSAMPWLCLLAVLGPAPYCLAFSRTLPTFMIYACATFGLIAVYLVMEAAEILSKRQIFDPFLGVVLPFSAFLLPILWKYYRLR